MFVFLFLLGTFTMMFNGLRVSGNSLGFSEACYVAAFGALLFERLYRRVPIEKWLPWHPYTITAALILVGGFLSTVTTDNRQLAGLFITFKAGFFFWAWIAMLLVMVVERKQEKNLLIAFLTVPVLSSGIAVYDGLTRSNIGASLAYRIGNASTAAGSLDLVNLGDAFGRYAGILGHPNIQSEFTVVVLPVLLVPALFAWRSRQWWKALFLTPLALIVLGSNLYTGSVTGIVCVVVGLVITFGIGWLREFPRYVIPSAAVALAIALVFLFVVSLGVTGIQLPSVDPSENVNIQRALSTTGPGRLVLMELAFEAIADNPIFGYGIGWVTGEGVGVVAGEEVHNGPIRAWLYGGLLVFVGVMYAYWNALTLALATVWGYLKGMRDPIALGLAIATFGWVISDMTTPSFYQRFTWFTTILLFALYLRSRQAAPEPMPPPELADSLRLGPSLELNNERSSSGV